MAVVGVKRLIVDNVLVQTKTNTAEYKVSGAVKTPVLDDGSGDVMFNTQERTSGMIKVEVSTLLDADTDKLRDLDGSEIVLELLDGKNIVGSNMTQSADPTTTAADGIVAYEFTGNVRVS